MLAYSMPAVSKENEHLYFFFPFMFQMLGVDLQFETVILCQIHHNTESLNEFITAISLVNF